MENFRTSNCAFHQDNFNLFLFSARIHYKKYMKKTTQKSLTSTWEQQPFIHWWNLHVEKCAKLISLSTQNFIIGIELQTSRKWATKTAIVSCDNVITTNKKFSLLYHTSSVKQWGMKWQLAISPFLNNFPLWCSKKWDMNISQSTGAQQTT